MTTRAWLDAGTRRAIADLVRAIERETSAEVVVAVRVRSDAYRHVDLAVGSVFGLLALLGYVFLPYTFHDDVAPIAIAACYGAGVALSRGIDAIRRPFVSRAARRRAVRAAAREAFVDQGVAGTRSRRGVLVFLSLFEREAEVVADIGVDLGTMGEAWPRAVAAVEGAMRRPSTVDAVSAALRELGAALARGMPLGDDDENELPDEVAE